MIEGVVNAAYEPGNPCRRQRGYLRCLRRCLADAADTTPLVGMRMLDRHNLNIDIEDEGRVIIQAKE